MILDFFKIHSHIKDAVSVTCLQYEAHRFWNLNNILINLSKEPGSASHSFKRSRVQCSASPIHMLIWLEKTTCFQANQQEFPVDWDANLIGWDPLWLGPIKRNVSFPVVVLRTGIPRIYWLKVLSHLTFAFVSPSRVILHVCICVTINTVLNFNVFANGTNSLQYKMPILTTLF